MKLKQHRFCNACRVFIFAAAIREPKRQLELVWYPSVVRFRSAAQPFAEIGANGIYSILPGARNGRCELVFKPRRYAIEHVVDQLNRLVTRRGGERQQTG